MWFKNLQIYRLPKNWVTTADALAKALAPQKFTDATSMDMVSQGWAPPRGADQPLVHAVGGQFLLQLKTQKKLLPTSVINQVAAARALEMKEAQGFAPGKKAMKELKERITDELLPRAFPLDSITHAWIDPGNGWLVVDAASPSKADEVVKLLLKAVDKLPLESLRVMRSPVGTMTEWVQADDAPTGFTVDMDATLKATGESKATVQWKRHTLDAAELGRHIAAGKQCTRLAMTWNDKISFVLDESLAIKSVKPLDVLTEREAPARDDAERFDSDFALMTGELAKLMADLVEALGGEADAIAPVPQPAADTGPAKGDEPVRAPRPVLQLNSEAAGAMPAGDGSTSDPLYEQAVEAVRKQQRASVSLVQRLLRIGYNRAARLIETMAAAGVIKGTQGIYTVVAVARAAA